VLTTLAYRLDAELAGTVTVYPATPEVCHAWEGARNQFSQRERAARGSPPRAELLSLPRRSLAVALRAVLGDVAVVNDPYPPTTDQGSRTAGAWLITRLPVDPWLLHTALAAWEAEATTSTEHNLAEAVSTSHPVRVDLGHLVAAAASAPNWVWTAAAWEAMRRLQERPLDLGYRRVVLRLDSDASLLTWDDLITIEGGTRTHAGIHRVTWKVISMPGESWPLLRLDACISRVATSDFRVEHAWVELDRQGSALLHTEIWARRRDGKIVREYPPGLARAIEAVSPTRLPELSFAAAHPAGPVRLQYTNEGSHWLGTGPGQAFLGVLQDAADEQLGDHRRLDLEPTDLRFVKRVTGPPSPSAIAGAVHGARARRLLIHVLPADGRGRERMRRLISQQLAGDVETLIPADGDILDAADAVRVVFHPPNPGLVNPGVPQLPPIGTSDGDDIAVALIETSAELGGAKDDPKPLIRAVLAERGIASQFLDASTTPKIETDADHPALNAWRDALRAAGLVDDRLDTAARRDGQQAMFVGIHLTQPQGEGGIAVVLTALVVDDEIASSGPPTWRALGYRPAHGWTRYVDALTDYHSSDLVAKAHRSSGSETREVVARYVDCALDQLLRELPSHRAVAYLDTDGKARQVWSGLTNKRLGTPPLPGGPPCADRLAVVRLNSTNEIPQPVWNLTSTGRQEMPMRLFVTSSPDSWLLVNKSQSLQAFSGARDGSKTTRFHVADGQSRGRLGDNWHSLTATEITVVRSAGWEPRVLADVTARLCHQAISWDGRTTTAAPLHMAKQIYEDHPARR
jgi:hypothetical protein